MDFAAFQKRLAEQNNRCKICELQFSDRVKTHVDVWPAGEHAVVHGIICKACSRTLGRPEKSLPRLLKSARYLCKAMLDNSQSVPISTSVTNALTDTHAHLHNSIGRFGVLLPTAEETPAATPAPASN